MQVKRNNPQPKLNISLKEIRVIDSCEAKGLRVTEIASYATMSKGKLTVMEIHFSPFSFSHQEGDFEKLAGVAETVKTYVIPIHEGGVQEDGTVAYTHVYLVSKDYILRLFDRSRDYLNELRANYWVIQQNANALSVKEKIELFLNEVNTFRMEVIHLQALGQINGAHVRNATHLADRYDAFYGMITDIEGALAVYPEFPGFSFEAYLEE